MVEGEYVETLVISVGHATSIPEWTLARGARTARLECAGWTSGADLFVVCKHCGSEVSPYVTECPYCGNRLVVGPRSCRAPPSRAPPLGAWRDSAGARLLSGGPCGRWATLTLVAAGAALYVARHTPNRRSTSNSAILGPLRGDWWRLLSARSRTPRRPAFVAMVSLAIFGTLSSAAMARP